MCTTIIDKDIVWYGAVNALGYATEEDNVIKNDGRDWRHFEMPNCHFILVKWVCISLSIQKSSNSFQYLQNWKEFDTMIAHKIYHWCCIPPKRYCPCLGTTTRLKQRKPPTCHQSVKTRRVSGLLAWWRGWRINNNALPRLGNLRRTTLIWQSLRPIL